MVYIHLIHVTIMFPLNAHTYKHLFHSPSLPVPIPVRRPYQIESDKYNSHHLLHCNNITSTKCAKCNNFEGDQLQWSSEMEAWDAWTILSRPNTR